MRVPLRNGLGTEPEAPAI